MPPSPDLSQVRAPLPAWLGVLLAVGIGVAIPVQSRVNGQLGAEMGDGVAAALVSFAAGLVLMGVLALVLPDLRRGLRALRPAISRRAFPPAYVLAGLIGAFLVFTQTTTVAVIGVAVFTVAVVAGQTLGGLLVDGVGFAQAARRRPTAARVVGAALVLVAVGISASASFVPGRPVLELLLPALLALLAGTLTGFQQAMNGRIGTLTRSPLTATVTNFSGGTLALTVVFAVRLILGATPEPLPGDWWLYLGGPLGIVFIAGSAALVPHTGVLLLGLGVVTGQLLGSLALDAVAPAAGAGVTVTTVVGTVIALGAVVIATLPSRRARA
ncbi:DMT family transporter [Georgenia faecalis]|uniref:DMT family transporter n=1 Tax=Georgenia faecalis TaxID=2483799 RepID=UPI001F494B5B|nr:DMT family transporter [Georgenia faecalis]